MGRDPSIDAVTPADRSRDDHPADGTAARGEDGLRERRINGNDVGTGRSPEGVPHGKRLAFFSFTRSGH